jgi:hypothetical protein
MNDEIVVLRKYADEFRARLDATVLEAHGIPAQVSADTGGGALPSMALLMPVRLLVRAEDAELAAEVLDAPAAPPDDDEGEPAA